MSNVILVDENDNVLGEVSRQEAHLKGLLHRVAVVYLTNEKREILVQERMNGPLDHSSAGHVDVGESYLEAAKRELEEELGAADVELKDIGRTQSQDKSATYDRKHMFRVYVCKANPVKLQEEEVKSVFWANPEEILKDMKNNPKKYTNGFKSTLKLFLSTK